MAEIAAGWAFADAFVPEDETTGSAREAAHRFGIEPVSPAVGAALALAASASPAGAMIEIGTGTGVSGLSLLKGAPEAVLTTIDSDLDHHQVARSVFQAAGHSPRRTRLITGRAADVLPRMNEQAYDLVFVDADWEPVEQYVDSALRLVRPGGSVLVAHVLQRGRVANPARRDPATVVYRRLLTAVRERDDVLAGLSIVGDGLLHLVRRPADRAE
ncbi:O-methyltransferase [Amnibacterium setariae]|uniref:Methyltransferase domain-containing protein n=1 Tax=Amnibacterium setariae TaxID=2306585 RepID=A0A3A1U3H4_9MICO|nr:class I SAM-dependent methyltransferase [Amnibacterium setariae]RIX30942.1 methyltransferase domain-containing protein [Amnibacterium setariae]